MRLLLNASSLRNAPIPESAARSFGPPGASEVGEWLGLCPRHMATPMWTLAALASELGVKSVLVKDESNRLGLSSFKALGGAYAVARFVQRHAERVLGRPVAPGEVRSPEVRAAAAGLTVTSATDGNHGRSVAAGARVFGCNAVIFVHGGVSPARVQAIAGFGADVRRVRGNYEDSVQAAAQAARSNGWILLADTTSDASDEAAELVMQGYAAMAAECIAATSAINQPPTHVFLQAGVGGMAAAVATHWELARRRGAAPRFIVVEPEVAACLFASAANGDRPVTLAAASQPTVMAMLDCQTPSTPAYALLQRLAHAYLAIDDAAAVQAMKVLARPRGGDPRIVAGESGAAGLAGLLAAMADDEIAGRLGLGPESVVLVINTEGATDPDLYAALTGP